ncbi:hypothetical protein KFU94_46865 [Chloroflexi bacterium TSY]|nr:hypothetical protein [Chloroflexi bacterium TSY]
MRRSLGMSERRTRQESPPPFPKRVASHAGGPKKVQAKDIACLVDPRATPRYDEYG